MKAIILAGGKGTRLRPYTTTIPKPLMPIGDKAILEIVINQLKENGIDEVVLAVGYLSELIQAYFGDGEKYGIKITYSKEDKPLGTAGPIANVEGLDDSFLIMNGDILTKIPFKELIAQHKESGAALTVATTTRNVNIDFGVIRTNDQKEITNYDEKPKLSYDVSMGINVIHPRVLEHIKKGEKLDIPDLIRILIKKGEKVMSYHTEDYWLDIGRPDDYMMAQEEYEKIFLQ